MINSTILEVQLQLKKKRQKLETQATYWEKVFITFLLDKGLYPEYIKIP